MMKKFAMAAIAAAAMGAGVAQAYTTGTFSNGFVVPNVIHNGSADTTAVGLINSGTTTVPVYWAFFDQNSNHVTDGCFTMTGNQYKPFVWSEQSGLGLGGQRGYLVFAQGSTTTCDAVGTAATTGTLNGSAFQVNTTAQDVAVIPVIEGALTFASGTDLTKMGPDSLTTVAGALQVTASNTTKKMYLRYGIDGAANTYASGGVDTHVILWSTGDQSGTPTVNVYNDQQQRKSVTIKLTNTEQERFDPESIAGLPADYTDGFIEWVPTLKSGTTPTAGSVFGYSVIEAGAYGAVQSIMGAHN